MLAAFLWVGARGRETDYKDTSAAKGD
jgi:hypothetical protein